jgi:hypothetical protein
MCMKKKPFTAKKVARAHLAINWGICTPPTPFGSCSLYIIAALAPAPQVNRTPGSTFSTIVAP